MDHLNCFKDLFVSLPDYRKKVFSKFLIQRDSDLLKKC